LALACWASAPGGLLACFGGAIGIADRAGGGDGLGNPFVRGGLALALCRGRHFRQEIKVFLVVVLCQASIVG